MARSFPLLAATLLMFGAVACGGGEDERTDSGTGAADAGAADSGATDSGAADAGATDSGTTDAGDTDAGDTDAGDTDAGDADAGETGGPTVFHAALSGAQEVPPVATDATGTLALSLNAAEDMITYTLTHTVSGATAAHLHLAPPGRNGGVAVPLVIDGAEHTAAVTAENVLALKARGLYVNVHSPSHAGGEIRGQVLLPDEVLYVAKLEGVNAVPPNMSQGSGVASVVVSGDETSIAFHLGHDLTATNAHIHKGLAGSTGGVEIGLNPSGPDTVGEAAVTSEQLGWLETGFLYVNVHSADVPGGEIRGQLLPAGSSLFVASLDPYQAALGSGVDVESSNEGAAQVVVDYARENISFAGSSTVPGTRVRIEKEMAGIAGEVLAGPTIHPNQNVTWSSALAQGDLALIEGGVTYVNWHTAAYPIGELRGQLVRPGERLYVARLTGKQAVPPISDSDKTGHAQLLLNHGGDHVRYVVKTTATPTAAHFHRATAGGNGGVVLGATAGQSMSGEADVTAAQAADIELGLWYFNVHTAAAAGGELRGQMFPPGTEHLVARMSAGQSVPPLESSSTASGMIVIPPDTDEIGWVVQTTATPTAAHIHGSPGGTNGGVIQDLGAFTDGIASGTFEPTLEQLLDGYYGQWYFNIHTTANPGGELRGQILVPGELLFTAALTAVEGVTTGGSGGVQVVLGEDWEYIYYSGKYAGITPTASHIHNLDTSGVVYGLDLADGLFDGEHELTLGMQETANLLIGKWYVNVHTSANPGGDISGVLERR